MDAQLAPPPWIAQFAKLLKDYRPVTCSLAVGDLDLRATLGIREVLWYSERPWPWQMLGRDIEYYVLLPHGKEIPLSCQIYWDENKHWRLFLYTRGSGMLLSIHLPTVPPSNEVVLKQKMRIVTQKIGTQSLSPNERVHARDALVRYLQREGFRLQGNDLELGIYNPHTVSFKDTSPEYFITDFIRAGLIKGHFMANKGYHIF